MAHASSTQRRRTGERVGVLRGVGCEATVPGIMPQITASAFARCCPLCRPHEAWRTRPHSPPQARLRNPVAVAASCGLHPGAMLKSTR